MPMPFLPLTPAHAEMVFFSERCLLYARALYASTRVTRRQDVILRYARMLICRAA